MTIYNARGFLRRSIGSIQKQSFTDWEIVAVDDGSSDGTVELLQELSMDDNRIQIFQPGRLGRYPALNFGLQHARGELVAIMDADDYSYPERLAKQVAYFEAHREVAGLGSGYYLVDEINGRREARLNPQDNRALRRALALYIPICHTSGMCRRSAALDAGGYIYCVRPPYRAPEDLRLWVNLAKKHELANLPDILVDHYVHSRSFKWDGGVLINHWALMRINAYAIKTLGLGLHLYLLVLFRPVYLVMPKSIKSKMRQFVRGVSDLVLPRE